MATVYKRTRRRSIPKGAEIITRGGKQYATWTDKRTKRQRRAPLADDARAILLEEAYYTIEYFDHKGQRRRVGSKTPDKDAAQRLANQLETRAMERDRGLIDVSQERFASEGRRALGEHLADFLVELEAKGNTRQHCHETYTQAMKVTERLHAGYISDLTASAVQEAIAGLRGDGLSLGTCNHYLRSIKSFSRWLQRDKRTRDDALATLEAYNAATDPRHVRRELTPEELTWLVTTTTGRTRIEHKLNGPDRAMVYQLALGTGFRAKELRSLTPASFALDQDPPTVTVRAGHSKRRRNDVQPIRRDLADSLRSWLARRPAGERLFARLPVNAARMLRSDLAAARAAWIADASTDAERAERAKSDFLVYRDTAGEVADFHSTRHTLHIRNCGWGCVRQDGPGACTTFQPNPNHRPVCAHPAARYSKCPGCPAGPEPKPGE